MNAGRVVLITGTAGGQGRAAAIAFAKSGAIVCGCDVNAEANAGTKRLVEAAGGVMRADTADLGDANEAQRWVDACGTSYGRIDVVYNNASAPRFGAIAEMSVEDWRYTIRNELDLVFFVTRAAWRWLAKQGGVIINTASVSAHSGSRSVAQAAHCATKGAVLAMTRQLAVEGAAHGIRAVSISPGVVESPATLPLLADENIRRAVLGDVPLARAGRPEDIANLAVFLASEQAGYITGADFLVDGGRQAI